MTGMNRSEDIRRKYGDIIDLPHYVSKTRPQMSMVDRAAQFSPFSALTGYDAAVTETARLTDEQAELDEGRIAALDERLQGVRDRIVKGERPEITVTYFQPDEKKSGGSYVTVVGTVKRVDEYARVIEMMAGNRILIDRIYEIICDGGVAETDR